MGRRKRRMQLTDGLERRPSKERSAGQTKSERNGEISSQHYTL